MDAASNIIKQDSIRCAAMHAVLVLFFVFELTPFCRGQQLTIRSRDKNQEIVYDLNQNEQFFKEVRWDVHNSLKNQSIAVIWTADAFRSGEPLQRGNNLADTELALQIQNSGPKNAWRITQPRDTTDIAKGDRSAMVSAVSIQPSQATFGVTVMFRCNDRAIPAAGRYRTVLVGTIAAL